MHLTPKSLLENLGIGKVDLDSFVGIPGRIAIVHGPRAEVIWADDNGDERIESLDIPSTIALQLVAGDWVSLSDGRIVASNLRRTALRRPRRRSAEMQILAANIDLVLIVVPVDRALNLLLLERLAVMAWDSGARPVVVLSKVDTVENAVHQKRDVEAVVPGIDVMSTSSISGWGIETLRAMLTTGVTAVMLGPSGVGKTSLLNALEGTSHRTRDVSRSGEGRHATSTRRLHLLTSGGVLLDIPGIRLADLSVDRTTLEGAFADIVALSGQCRFRDCAHTGEEGCALDGAVSDGRLASRRLELWRTLHRDLVADTALPNDRPRDKSTRSGKKSRPPDSDEYPVR